MPLSQNLTPKRGFVQKCIPRSDRILKKVPYFLKIDVFDTLNTIPEFPFIKKNKNKTRIPCFLGHLQLYLTAPSGFLVWY